VALKISAVPERLSVSLLDMAERLLENALKRIRKSRVSVTTEKNNECCVESLA
jgi:hypothetical protein